jgi:hypothetical protein
LPWPNEHVSNFVWHSILVQIEAIDHRHQLTHADVPRDHLRAFLDTLPAEASMPS